VENDIKPKSEENLLTKVSTFNQFLEQKVESMLLKILNIARYIFIVMMIVYLGQCFVSLGYKMVAFTISQGALDFDSIKIILTDSLFVLIVLAIVKTLFIQDGSVSNKISFLTNTTNEISRKVIA
jgi:hypothetical protein